MESNYKSYIRSKLWEKVKEEKYATTKNWCLFCRSKENLHVHHVLYRTNLYTVRQSDLVIVCKSCHSKIHFLLKRGVLVYNSNSPAKRIKQTRGKLKLNYSIGDSNKASKKLVLIKSSTNNYLQKLRDTFGDFYLIKYD